LEIVQPSWAWTPEGVLQDPVITIGDGRILRCSAEGRHPDGPVLRLPGHLIVPGLVNAHSHAFQRAFRGHVQWRDGGRDDFWSWREAMYRVAGALDADAVEAISRLAFLEMMESGITEVGEFHYLHHRPDGRPYEDPDVLARRVVAAARDVGLRITLLWVAYARGGPGQPLSARQRRFGVSDVAAALDAVDRLGGLATDGVRIGLAPHSVRAVPPAWWPDLATFEGPLHVHVAEQPREVEACRAETGQPPLALLEAAGVLSPRFTAVHLTWPDEGDVDRLVAADAQVCVCPSTELDLGDGFLPVAVREAARLCLGSDSHARIDLLHEARTLELHARGLTGRRNVLAPPGERHGLAERLLRAATTAGSRALGGPEARLRPGDPADLVAIDLSGPAFLGVPPLEAAIFGADPGHVRHVWVGGRRVVRDGRHPERDAALAAARPVLEALFPSA
jgi:formimidoylglutamate deiminase